jgi:aminomethyltransferase
LLKRTVLFDCHKKAGAKFTDFGGWEMPVQYSGLIDEHQNTRINAGLFDVSHMGEIFVSGAEALEFLQFVTTNDVSKLTIGKAQYSFLLNETGGVIDDIIVYRLAEDRYLICVNASNVEKDFSWLKTKNTTSAVIENCSEDYAQIAIQGPKAQSILSELLKKSGSTEDLSCQKNFSIKEISLSTNQNSKTNLLVARTGYTGEDGFEVFLKQDFGVWLWESLLELGQNYGLKPVGLGARDTLRLEAALPLYGHELNAELSVLGVGYKWAIKPDKGNFVGRESIVKEWATGSQYKLFGVEVLDRGIIRDGAKIFIDEELTKEVGWVTSGTFSPTLNRAIALAYLDQKNFFGTSLGNGTEIFAELRGRALKVAITDLPFYARKK